MVQCEVCGARLQDDAQTVGLFCPNNCDRERDRANQIPFYSRDKLYGWLSNFHRAEIEVDGKKYPTVEHFYQSMKTISAEVKNWIISAPSPFLAMKAGRSLRKDKELVIYWDECREVYMLKGLRAKFTQNPHLKQNLLETGDTVLFEDSPTDMFWGGRLAGSKDTLGKLIMQVRSEIQKIKELSKMKLPNHQVIRKVSALGDRCRKQADDLGLKENDLVLVETFLRPFPEYILTKIEGSPTDFLQKRFFGEEVDQ